MALKSPLTDVESFPGNSGMYPSAEVKFAVLVVETYVVKSAAEKLKSVPPDRDVEGRGGKSVHLETILRLLLGIEIVAAGGAVVAGRNGHCNSLRGGLLPQSVYELISGCTLESFASAKAHVQDAHGIIIERPIDGEKETCIQIGVRRGVEHLRGAGCEAAGNLKIEQRLNHVAVDAGIVAVDDHGGRRRRQPEEAAVVIDVRGGDIRVAGDADAYAAARVGGRSAEFRIPGVGAVIDCGRISRDDKEK